MCCFEAHLLDTSNRHVNSAFALLLYVCLAGGGRSLDSGLVELTPVTGISANSEESYSIIAMNTLLRILRTPAYSGYHRRAVGTLGMITRSLSAASIPFLQTVRKFLELRATALGDCLVLFRLHSTASWYHKW